jgi:hypothetical protein
MNSLSVIVPYKQFGMQFVFVQWERWGQKIEYKGFTSQDGTVTRHFEGENALQELTGLLGVALGAKGHFPPLSPRFYW